MPDTLVKRNANVNDTIKLIVETVNKEVHSEFVKKLASALKPEGDKIAYMKRLFDYVCRNIKYCLDGEVEGVQREKVHKPSTTVRNRKGDCKKMTVLIASVLKVAGIEPLIKHVFYDGENFTHVYVIVPYPNLSNYIIVDPVNDCKFNKEVSYSSANIFDLKGNRMDLYTGANNNKIIPGFKDHINMMACAVDQDMSSITGTNPDQTLATITAIFEEDDGGTGIQGIGKRKKKTKEERKENRKKVAAKIKNVVKKVGAAPMRGAFLGLVRLNAMKLATHIAKAWAKDKKGIENFWIGFGGDPNELKKTVIAGSGTNISGAMPIQTGMAVAAAVTAAMPVILALLTKLKDMGQIKEGDSVDNLINDTIDNATDAVEDGTVTEDDIAKSAPPDKGPPVIKNIKAVITKAPSAKVEAELQTTSTPQSNNNSTPTNGSFFSAWGMCWWGMMLTGKIQISLTAFPILLLISSIIATYFVFGFLFFGWIYQMDLKWKKYISWYFDIPIKFFSFIIQPFKNFSLKKIIR